MTAYIDNITIVGTPEEIYEFIELKKGVVRENFTPPHLPDERYSPPTYWGGYHTEAQRTNPDRSITIEGNLTDICTPICS